MENLRQQAENFGTKVIFQDAASLELGRGTKRVHLDEEVLETKTVILATGSEYRHLNIPGEEKLTGRGVSFCATCDGFFFRDKNLLVVGGGDSAMEEALFLTRFARKVTVIHRRDQLRASKVMQERAFENPKIDFVWNARVSEILGTEKVEGVEIINTVDGEVSTISTDGVFVAVGHLPRTKVLDGQLELNEEGYILVEEPSTATSVPGVFACGDVVDHTYRQAITAAGTGCRAALDVGVWLEKQA